MTVFQVVFKCARSEDAAVSKGIKRNLSRTRQGIGRGRMHLRFNLVGYDDRFLRGLADSIVRLTTDIAAAVA